MRKKNPLAHLAIDGGLGDVELPDHAEGDGPAAGLGVVHLALEEDGVDVLLLGEDLGGARAGGSAPDDRDLVLHVEGRGGSDLVGHASSVDEGGGGEGGGGPDEDGGDDELHCGFDV